MLTIPPIDILLVEDSPHFAELLQIMLGRLGARQVRIAGSLAAAQELFEAAPPALAILDQNLPDGLGTILMRSLRESKAAEAAGTRFILMSSAMDEAVGRLARRAGAAVTLTKPILPNELCEGVNAALRSVDQRS